MHNSFIIRATISILLLFVYLSIFTQASAYQIAFPITNSIPSMPVNKGAVFFSTELKLNYQTGKIILSQNPDGTGSTQVDDYLTITVRRPDGSIKSFNHFYPSQNCSSLNTLIPSELTSLFGVGENQVKVELQDVCGGLGGSTSLQLVNLGAPQPQPIKTPLILIPGIGGSELKVKQDTNWSETDGHGGIFTHNYLKDEKVWINELEALKPGNDDYFDILRLNSDGQTSPENLEITGNILSRSYQSMINFFVSNGYEMNKTLFIFPYDWRQDISTIDPLLDQKIDLVKSQTGSQKVDIIAHSMGGLIARAYIQDPQKALKVKSLVTLGTPNLGSVEYFKSIHYGSCVFVEIGPFCLSINQNEVKDVLQNYISGYELLPSPIYFDFYNNTNPRYPYPFNDERDMDDNKVVGPLDYIQTKTLLTNLGHNTSLFSPSEILHSLDNSLSNTNGVDWTIIAGSGQPTLGQIIEKYRINFLGIKIPKTDQIKINGDSTVPLFSASLEDQTRGYSIHGDSKVFYTNQKHGQLVENGPALELAKNIFDDAHQLPEGVSTTPYKLKGTLLSVHSPVRLDVYDQSGNHTGPTQEGDFEQNIPGSLYDTLGDAKFIWLPEDGQYQTKFTALDEGSFDFKIRNFENDIQTQTILYKDISITKNSQGETTVDTSNLPSTVLLLDQNGDGSEDHQIQLSNIITGDLLDDHTAPKTSLQIDGIKGLNDWYRTNLTISLQGNDESGNGIEKTEYSLDGGKTILNYQQPFLVSQEGISQLKFRSLDKAGNEETPQEVELKIDKTAPEAQITYDIDAQNFQIKGIDNLTDTQVNESDESHIFISDQVGNTTQLDIEPKDKKRKEYIKINSIKYNQDPPIQLANNHFTVKFSFNKKAGQTDKFDQNLIIKPDQEIEATYNSNKNMTIVEVKNTSQKTQKLIKQGIFFLVLISSSGNLEVKY